MADIADMADEHVTAEIEARIAQRVRYVGESAKDCDECGDELPEGRRVALPGVRLCIWCQTRLERRA